MGEVLHQEYKDIKQPLAFFSIKLNIVQCKYSAFSRELLAIYVRHFRHLLGSRGFIIFTDHKPLIYALHSKPDKYNPRDIRQLDYIVQFTSDIQHIQGNDNIVADTLSRESQNIIKSHQLDLDYLTSEKRKGNIYFQTFFIS